MGYEVFCNRDELHSRKPALPPVLVMRNGVRYLAPIDAAGGGSWIGVNEFGLTLCLVNHYPVTSSVATTRGDIIPPLREVSTASRDLQNTPFTEEIVRDASHGGIALNEYRSRGLLLTELLSSASPEIVATRLAHETMAQYRSFILLAFALHEPFRMFVWNEETLLAKRLTTAALPVTSSSFKTESVIASRRHVFNETVRAKESESPALLASFHRSHIPERSAYAVCMHREEAETVSFTQVRVQPGHAELHYLPHAPCAGSAAQRFNLRLHAQGKADEELRGANVGNGSSL